MVPAEIAHYLLLGKLGEGGMGEVYRATDSKLGREVAVKIIPEKYAQDPDRMARFSREARLLASLNHPNIAAIYGVEERALVMELVEGPTLAERIARGPIPVDEALPIIEQMVEALEYAHDRAIVHRDLKPANIKLTPEGRVKILDFGLAKAFRGSESDGSNPEASPTLTLQAEATGVIIGTAAYMSPEQARGCEVDRRTDIWAFGVVVYEMVTGRRLFKGETVSDTLAAVLRDEPDWNRVPSSLRALVRACLVRDAKRRIRDIGDARLFLHSAEPAGPLPERSPRRAWLPWAVAVCGVALAAGLGFQLWRAARPIESSHLWLTVDLGAEAVAGRDITAVLSPNGRKMVYPVRDAQGRSSLAIRDLDAADVSQLPDTVNGINPFFSPDSEWIGFFAGGKLKKISAHGGAALALCDAPEGRGGSWGEDNHIVFAGGTDSPLSRIHENGGTPEPITAPDRNNEWTHRWPQVLNRGRAVLFTANTAGLGFESARIEAVNLSTREVKTIWRGGYFGRYLPTGHVLFLHENTIFAMPFDPDRLEPMGTPVPVLQGISPAPEYGGGQFDFSRNGLFVFLSGAPSDQRWPLVWIDKTGRTEQVLEPGVYLFPKLSPDGTQLAYTQTHGPGKWDLWLFDLRKKTKSPLTFTGFDRFGVTWAPDGRHVVFIARPGRNWTINWIRAGGGEQPQILLNSPQPFLVGPSFAPDGKTLVFSMGSPTRKYDIWALRLDLADPDHPRAGAPQRVIETDSMEVNPAISPDGKWIAYASTPLANSEIFVQRINAGKPSASGKWQVSAGGGFYPVWSRSGPQLFYSNPETHRVMVVDYATESSSFHSSEHRPWIDKVIWGAGPAFDVSPDGKRLIAAMPDEPAKSKQNVHVTMLVNWFDDLRRRVPAKR